MPRTQVDLTACESGQISLSSLHVYLYSQELLYNSTGVPSPRLAGVRAVHKMVEPVYHFFSSYIFQESDIFLSL